MAYNLIIYHYKIYSLICLRQITGRNAKEMIIAMVVKIDVMKEMKKNHFSTFLTVLQKKKH